MDRICSFVFRAPVSAVSFFFFFNDTATTEIYTLSLHDALPISVRAARDRARPAAAAPDRVAELAPRDHERAASPGLYVPWRLARSDRRARLRPTLLPRRDRAGPLHRPGCAALHAGSADPVPAGTAPHIRRGGPPGRRGTHRSPHRARHLHRRDHSRGVPSS